MFDIPKSEKTVHIPYSIVEPDYSATFTKDLLQKLFSIARNKNFSRKDFFELLDNPVLRASRGIDASDVEAFKKWVKETNCYRDEKRDDWAKTVNRMLLARLTTKTVDNIVPFEDMESKSNSTLMKFIRLVDDLKEWIKLCEGGAIGLEQKDEGSSPLDNLKEALRAWIHIDPRVEGFEADRLSYAGAIGSFRAFEEEKEEGLKSVSLDVIERTVLVGAMSTEYSPAEIFTGGLTFTKFSTEHILPAKYTFLLGMDSKTIPGTDEADSLDLRSETDFIPQTRLNKRTFFTTIRETTEEVFLSYVDQDLAKDEEFFQSPLIAEITDNKPLVLGIDETRPWSQIFTSRGFRNKERNEELTRSSALEDLTLEKMKQLLEKEETPKVVTISQLKNFLKDPFIFHINRILHKEEEEQLDEDFEPLQLDSLINYLNLMQSYVKGVQTEGIGLKISLFPYKKLFIF